LIFFVWSETVRSPAEIDVGVMTFGFGKLAYLGDEIEACLKSPNRKLRSMRWTSSSKVQRAPFVEPLGFVARERWNPTAAGRARLGGKSFGHRMSPLCSVECMKEEARAQRSRKSAVASTTIVRLG